MREEYLKIAAKCSVFSQLKNEMRMHKNCAYLFECQDTLLSVYTACLLACEGSSAPQESCKKILDGNFVDVKIYGKEGLRKEDVDEIIDEAQRSPVSEKMKYFILDFSDANETVQNKLLKTIEDIPKTDVFFVISPSPSSTLPTIKSRCKVYYPSLSRRDITGIFDDAASPAAKCFGKNSLTIYNHIRYEGGEKAVASAISYVDYLGQSSSSLRAVSLVPRDRSGFNEHFLYVEYILGMILDRLGNVSAETYGAFPLDNMAKKFDVQGVTRASRIVREGLSRSPEANITSLSDMITIKLTEVAEKCQK